MKKILIVALALVLLLSSMAIVHAEEPTKLTWLISVTDAKPSMNMPVIAELCKRLNVELEFICVESNNFQTKFNLMLTDNDMPDLISTSLDQIVLYGKDKFVNFNDHKELMPDYYARLDEKQGLERVVTDDGALYGAVRITNSTEPQFGLFLRHDVLEANNIAIPHTLDELTEVFAQLKKLYPDSYAQTGRWGLDTTVSYWARWFKTRTGMYWNEDAQKWLYGATSAEYRACLEYLHMMYENGYLDPEIITLSDEQFYAKLYTGVAFGMSDYFGADTNCNTYATAENPSYDMRALPLPQIDGVSGKTAMGNPIKTSEMLVVSNTSKHMETALKLINYLYTEEGGVLMSWGVEDVTFFVNEEGKRQRTDLIISATNPDGQMTERETGCRIGHLGKYWDAEVSRASWGAAELYGKTMYREQFAEGIEPVMLFTEKQSKQISDIKTELDTYRAETSAAFITGDKSFEEYDSFVNTLIGMGAEELEAIYAKVYEAKK